MNLLLAAASGWGKSYVCQALTELNLPDYETTVVLDYKNEYWGLVDGDHGPGPAQWYPAGPNEAEHFQPHHYRELLEPQSVVVARHPRLSPDGWRTVCAGVIAEARRLGDALVVVDEAHFVAPQRQKTPHQIKGLATTGRGEGASAMWVTQRLTELEETVLAQTVARYLGGFESDNDLRKIRPITEYPEEVHRSGGHPVSGLPDSLEADGDAVSLRKWTDDRGRVTGSEWIYSDDSGTRERRDSSDLSPRCRHVGARGKPIRTE